MAHELRQELEAKYGPDVLAEVDAQEKYHKAYPVLLPSPPSRQSLIVSVVHLIIGPPRAAMLNRQRLNRQRLKRLRPGVQGVPTVLYPR